MTLLPVDDLARYGADVTDPDPDDLLRDARASITAETRARALHNRARLDRDAAIRALYLARARADPDTNPSTLQMSRELDLGDSLIRSIVRDLTASLNRARGD